jgi:hypothetical protein
MYTFLNSHIPSFANIYLNIYSTKLDFGSGTGKTRKKANFQLAISFQTYKEIVKKKINNYNNWIPHIKKEMYNRNSYYLVSTLGV